MRFLLPVVFVLIPTVLSGCASSGQSASARGAVKTESAYYEEAKQAISAGSFNLATTLLESLETNYPVGQYTRQAQLELIYTRYRQADYLGAIGAADRFIRLYPSSRNLDYVLYLRGLANFKADQDGILKRMPVNLAHRDLGQARVAFDDFRQLLTRYPASPYALDARQRMIFLRNQLAEGELNIARYYQQRGASVAALNRARWVVENYPGSPSVPEALQLMIAQYEELGMTDLANQAKALLPAATAPSTP